MAKGLSTKGLARLHEVMAGHVERGAMPGLITLVARHGDVHVDVIGAKAFGHPEPMERDAIFRIASLTKPIAAVAAMALVEEGTLQLDAPVDDLLSELADRQVLRSLDADLDDTVPANRPITLEDLLTFRLGFGCIMAPPNTYPIQRAEEELQLRSLGPPWPPTPHSPDTWIRRLGTLPLMYQPGEQWLYNTGARHRRWLPLVDRPAPTCRSSTGWICPTSALEDVSRSRPPLAGLIIRVQELAQPQGQAPTADAPAQAVTQPPEQRDLRVEARTPRG
jgi:hypothetical protein